MIKTSEFAPATSELLRRMLGECFGEDEVAVIGGAVASAQAFNALPFDHLVFTGSPMVGRHVMRAAAEHLTPVTLELGGKSPAIVGSGADLEDAALRIAHGKAFNAGQICVAPDYALVPRGKSAEFAAAVRRAFTRLYPQVGGNDQYTSIITERHASRLREMLADAQAKGATVVRCGDDAGSGRQIPLHVVTGVDERMQLMQEEIFGPILPVLEYDHLDEAMALVRGGERPLALYAFGLDRAQQARMLQETHAGGVTINDWGWHVFQHDMPFGGVGNSGMGSYHGKEGFRELSHCKAVFKRRRWFPIGLFYPPYGNIVQRLSMRFYLGKG
jgi:coniferyl-aldehyde dehydrogenase